jgi:3-oxoacyl-[acyl-carrier protein] reductase
LFLAGKDEASIQRVEQNSMGRIVETANITPTVAFLVSDTAGWVNCRSSGLIAAMFINRTSHD